MRSLDELNSLITEAIYRAEDLTSIAASEWDKVATFEREIANHPQTPENERKVAWRGESAAATKATIIVALDKLCGHRLMGCKLQAVVLNKR